MPGAYAHITLVNEFRTPELLENIKGFPKDGMVALYKRFKYCELGAVSPDYPYLALGDGDAADWADLMHYTHTGQMIHAGIKLVRAMSGDMREKCLAWLLGYAAHVAADVTIHPVVELIVGPYKGNEKHHRVCEMNQDAYIFQRLNVAEVGLSDHLESGIAACSDPDDDEKMDPDIVNLWIGMMKEVHPTIYTANSPDVNKWHDRFNLIVEEIAEAGNHLLPFARHLGTNSGLIYPAVDQIDKKYIENLIVPFGTMNYDELFSKAIESVSKVWLQISKGVLSGDTLYVAQIGNWDLDTGRNEKNELVFWG